MNTLTIAFLAVALATVQDPPADPVQSMVEEFRNLQTSLQNLNGVRDETLPVIEEFSSRVDAALADAPENPRLLAVSLQVAMWLDDPEAVSAGFERLIEATGEAETFGPAWLDWFTFRPDADPAQVDAIYESVRRMMPDNTAITIKWIQRLQRAGRYAESCAVLDEAEIDLLEHPRMGITKYQCCMALHRFDDAKAALESIPEEKLESEAGLKSVQSLNLLKVDNYIEFWTTEQELRSAEAAADDLPRVEIDTDKGRIVLELYENEAPNTVANFISLVESEFYDSTKVHLRMSGDLVEAGDPRTREEGEPATENHPGYRIADEHGADGDRVHFAGSVGMAHGVDKDSAGSMFYITMRPLPERNKIYTIFGRVIEGMDIVSELQKDDVMQSFRVVRKRDHDYTPDTIPVGGAAASTTPPVNVGSATEDAASGNDG